MTTEEKIKQQYPHRVFPKRTIDDVVEELLKTKGITKYIEVDGVSEGDVLPGGVYKVSGAILTQNDKIYDYWLIWDPEKIAPDGSKGYYSLGENSCFTDEKGERHCYFEEVTPEEYKRHQTNPAYLDAKKKLGIK